jgi:regulation of enolase protein 1 (concanavalin A-like superfamily)
MRIEGWGRVVDPDGDCTVSIEGARVKILVPETSHEFAAELKRWNAPRIARTVRQDFIAQVKVCGDFEPPPGGGTTKGRKAYHGGGLLLVADEQNHLSIHRAAFRDGGRVQNYLNFELRRDGKVVISRYEMSIPPEADGYVRLERHGKRFIGMFSPDGVNWKPYEPIETDFPAKAQIGVAVVNSTKQTFTCAFEAFELFRTSAAKKASAAESDVATATGATRSR